MAKAILINQRPVVGKGTTLGVIFKRPPSLGLAYIKASLESRGHRAVIANVSSPEEAKKVFSRNRDVDCVGISSLTYTAGNAYRTAAYFREQDIPVALGGVHASIFPDDAEPNADYIVLGEGERMFSDMMDNLDKNGSLGTEKFVGAAMTQSGKRIPDPKHRICDLDSLPPPQLCDVRQRLHPVLDWAFWHGIPFGVQIATSRGCPHSCSFCKVPFLQGRQVRAHGAEYIGRLLEDYHSKGARSFMFVDDNFSFDTERVSAICRQIIDRNLDISWFCLCRANWVRKHRELVRLMRKAGCAMVYFGMESSSQKLLDEYGKGITPEDSAEATRILKEEGIGTIISVILGGQRDTVDTMKATLSMLEGLKPDMIQLSVLTQLDELQGKDYEKYTMERVVIEHPTIPSSVIEKMLIDFNITFYGSRENQDRMDSNIGWIINKSMPWYPRFLRRASFRHVSGLIADNFREMEASDK